MGTISVKELRRNIPNFCDNSIKHLSRTGPYFDDQAPVQNQRKTDHYVCDFLLCCFSVYLHCLDLHTTISTGHRLGKMAQSKSCHNSTSTSYIGFLHSHRLCFDILRVYKAVQSRYQQTEPPNCLLEACAFDSWI